MSSPLLPKGFEDEVLRLYAEAQKDPFRFAIYADRPLDFCHDILGITLWPKQASILELALGPKRRIAIRSGHGVGKSFGLACLAWWWFLARQGLVITTAPTKTHLEDVLWREIHAVRRNALVALSGEPHKLDVSIDETWYMAGVTTDQEGAFMGRHHKRLLLLADEATGLSEQTMLEMETCATGAENLIVLIGNPVTTSGTFYEAFKNPRDWATGKISCLDHPNVTEGRDIIPGAVNSEWIDRRRRLWGEHHPFWYSRVLGDFPPISARAVIPLAWVERAQNDAKRKAALEDARAKKLPRVAGLDVARYGDNLCVFTVRQGDAVESIESWAHSTLTQTSDRVQMLVKAHKIDMVVIDASGLGVGVYDILNERGLRVYGYNGGSAAFRKGTYSNRRSEMWWHLRMRFEKERLWIPEAKDTMDMAVSTLTKDLTAPEYEMPTGRIKVETKEKLLDRGVPSPDFADSLCLCFAAEPDPEEELEGGPSRGQDALAFEELRHPSGSEEAPFDQFPLGF